MSLPARTPDQKPARHTLRESPAVAMSSGVPFRGAGPRLFLQLWTLQDVHSGADALHIATNLQAQARKEGDARQNIRSQQTHNTMRQGIIELGVRTCVSVCGALAVLRGQVACRSAAGLCHETVRCSLLCELQAAQSTHTPTHTPTTLSGTCSRHLIRPPSGMATSMPGSG